ncbi:hypothetical protein ACV3K4_08825 [Clostridium perfringens]|uniref:hypothetical protein n=2 Tax=Clostridium perfringens TaxID=1502 RepID=UPI0011C22EF6|nr:hypothetical protein [Clostridium perfringens]
MTTMQLLEVLEKLDVEIACGDKDEKGYFDATFKANGKEVTIRLKRNDLLDYCFLYRFFSITLIFIGMLH